MLRAALLTVIAVIALSIPRQVVLADVIDGGGCTPTGQVEVELPDGSTKIVDGTAPDPDVLQAMNARLHFLGTWRIQVLMFLGVVVGVGIDLSAHPASLDVVADHGTFLGVSDVSYAQSLLPSSFEGVPVMVTEIETGYALGEDGGGGVAIFKNAADGETQVKPK